MRKIHECAEDIKNILNDAERTEEVDGDMLCSINELVDEILSIYCLEKQQRKMAIAEEIAMTENEAIREFQNIRPHSGMIPVRMAEAVDTAIQALEEVQQYRQIGTVEECREAVEKQTAKKPTLIDYKKYTNFVDNADFLQDAYWCPNCKRVVRSGSFCRDCGQKLGWSDEE